jgi:dimethylaniline monooxygenase (N-oxide forming)
MGLTMQETALPYDLVVVGAGPRGLITAHNWLKYFRNPESRF